MDLNIEDFIPFRPIIKNDVVELAKDYTELLFAEQECFKAARLHIDDTSTNTDDIKQSKEAVLAPLRSLLPLVRKVRDEFAGDMKELSAIRAAVKAQFKASFSEEPESTNTNK